MTLELVELLGHSLLGGTALAAAGFSPPGCIRLMHALGFGGAEAVGGFWGMCSWRKSFANYAIMFFIVVCIFPILTFICL